MALFNNNSSNGNSTEEKAHGILGAFSVDIIKWEPATDREASIIAHKFESEDFPTGSQLIVGPSQMAVFINNLTAGHSLSDDGSGRSQVSVFIGPCKIKLETGDSRFAPFRNISHQLTRGDSAYHSSVYFINTTYMNELNWGTQAPVLVVDPEEEVNVHVRAYGLFGAHIEQTDTGIAAVQASKFLRKVVGTRADYTRNELTEFMRAKILEYVPDLLAKTFVDKGIGVTKVSAHLSEFSAEVKDALAPHFDGFGLTLDNFSFHNINVPEEDIQAINELKIKKRQMKLEAEANAQKMDIESEAIARKREREGFTYQQEQSFGVLNAAAQNEGPSSGLMGAGMGLGMGFGIGGAVQAGMSSVMQNTFGNASARQGAGMPGGITCPKCGTALPPEARFCSGCGEKIEIAPAIFCLECGTRLDANARFCFNCGAKVQQSTVCPNCGEKLNPGAHFCPGCGTKI